MKINIPNLPCPKAFKELITPDQFQDYKPAGSYKAENHIWVTASGMRVPIHRMTTSHIHNCIRCLNGLGNKRIPPFWQGIARSSWIQIFQSELIKRQ